MKKYLNLFDFSQKVDYKIEILSGLTVAMALIPEAVAFALIAGLSPLTGLYAAFMMGFPFEAKEHRDKTIKLWNTLAECKYTIVEENHTDWISCVKLSGFLLWL